MKLIQTKLRGTGSLIETSWFQLSTHLNQFHFSNPEKGALFLRALQTLNPPFSCKEISPFAELPRHEQRGTHTRHIQAAKRTVSLGVFGAPPGLVTELGMLDQNLYETDRIEIGRRLDYSRWLNFVELSSSTRWKEIEPDVLRLLQPLKQTGSTHYDDANSLIMNLKGSDRIKGETASQLLFLLQELDIFQENKDLREETVALIERATHFQTAREVIIQRLPLLIYFNGQGDIAPPVSVTNTSPTHAHTELIQFAKKSGINIALSGNNVNDCSQSVVEKIQSGIQLSLLVSKESQKMDPIFLFDAPEINLPLHAHGQLRQLIQETAQSQQCFYLSRSKDFFLPADIGKSYSPRDLEIEFQ
ncbi:MAG: hypothetical protein ACI8ZB_004219 [Desulforhopalus sp.]|jgi:hypothetical protein